MAFTSLNQLIEHAEQDHTPIYELMIQSEIKQKSMQRDTIIKKMSEQFTVMEEAVRKGTTTSVMSRTGLTGGDGQRLYDYAKKGNSFVHPSTLIPQQMHWLYQK